MAKLVIERKKAIDLKMPYDVIVDENKIGIVENGTISTFELSEGMHTITITCGTAGVDDINEFVGSSFGILGNLFAKKIDKDAKKHKNNKNTTKINVNADSNITIICKAGAFDCVIKKVVNR